MIDRMSGRVALLLVVVALILVFLLGWFVLVSPQRSKASKLDTQVDETNVQLQAVTSLSRARSGVRASPRFASRRSRCPTTRRCPQILRQLSAAASAAGVELDRITPSHWFRPTGAEALPITHDVSRAVTSRCRASSRSSGPKPGSTDDKITQRVGSTPSTAFSSPARRLDHRAAAAARPRSCRRRSRSNAFVYAPTAVAAAPTTTTTRRHDDDALMSSVGASSKKRRAPRTPPRWRRSSAARRSSPAFSASS